MNNENTTKEPSSSQLDEAYRNAKTIKHDQFATLRTELPLWSIVCIEELCNKPYVLLGKEGDPESNVWVEFHGEDKTTLEKYYNWIEQGKKLFKEKAPTSHELDNLRRVLVSIGTLVGYLGSDLPDEIVDHLMTTSLTKFAVELFLKDHPDHDKSIESVVNDELSAPYLEMVIQYAGSLSAIISSINSLVKCENS